MHRGRFKYFVPRFLSRYAQRKVAPLGSIVTKKDRDVDMIERVVVSMKVEIVG